MANLEAVPHIGDRIFQYSSNEGTMKFRLVSQSWKNVIDNPKFWFRRLKTKRPSEDISQELQTLFDKAKSQKCLPEISKSLMFKYWHLLGTLNKEKQNTYKRISSSEWIEIRKFILGMPLIYYAIYSGNYELIKFFGDNATYPLTLFCPFKYDLLSPVKKYNTGSGRITLIEEAMKTNQDLKVIQYIISKMRLFSQRNFESMFDMYGYSPIHLAVLTGNIEVLKWLMSKTEDYIDLSEHLNQTLLHDICENTQFACSESADCKGVEMTKILVPKIKNLNVKDLTFNEIPLHQILYKFSELKKPGKVNECIKERIKILAPRSDLMTENLDGLSCYSYALTNLEIHEMFVQLNLTKTNFVLVNFKTK